MKNNDRGEAKYRSNQRKASLWTGCAALMLGIWLITNSAFSIPNCCRVGTITPANSWIPHEHSVTQMAGFPDGTVTFAVDADGNNTPNEDIDRESVVSNPDDHGHQHHDNGDPINPHRPNGGFGENDNDTQSDDANATGDPFSFFGVWDNRKFNFSEESGPFILGHGFIDEKGYGLNGGSGRILNIPTYCIDLSSIPEEWPDAKKDSAPSLVRDAIKEWSDIETDNQYLVTGIAFREIGSNSNLRKNCSTSGADIIISWNSTSDQSIGEADPFSTPKEIVFGTLNVLDGTGAITDTRWSFQKMPENVNVINQGDCSENGSECHFYSVALHEFGHIVGLEQQMVGDVDVMVEGLNSGCAQDVDPTNDNIKGPCFAAIDAESTHGVIDLYSIPTPDFGDAPASYPTRLEDNGARAPTLAYEWLGPRPANGISTTTREENANIVNRDLNFEQDGDMFVEVPENGCDIKGVIPDSFANVTYTVSVNNPTSARYADDATRLYVAIWVDWNRNGTWTDESKDGRLPVAQGGVPKELLDLTDDSHFVNDTNPRLWTDDEKMQGFKTFSKKIRVPKEAKLGETWMRCRLVYGLEPKTDPPSRTGARTYLESPNQDSLVTHGDAGLVFLNASPDNGGEIEDHKVCIGQPRAVKLTSADYITAGEEITFTITLENTTLCDYEAVDVFDALSGFVTFGQILQAPPGVFYNPERLAIDGQFSLASGETATIVYTVSVGDFVPSDSIIPNCVTLDGLSFRLERCSETIVIP